MKVGFIGIRRMATGFPLFLMLLHSSLNAADNRLSGTWRVEVIRGHAVLDKAKTELLVAEDGRVSTTVGCNRIAGTPKIAGDSITFGTMASTMMACPEPLGLLEANYTAALKATRSFQIEGQKLTFLDDAKAHLIIFSRIR